jgi:hypothetical protein
MENYSIYDRLGMEFVISLLGHSQTPADPSAMSTFSQAAVRMALVTKIKHQRSRQRRYGVFFEVKADLAWVGMYGGGCCSPAIAHQTPT